MNNGQKIFWLDFYQDIKDELDENLSDCLETDQRIFIAQCYDANFDLFYMNNEHYSGPAIKARNFTALQRIIRLTSVNLYFQMLGQGNGFILYPKPPKNVLASYDKDASSTASTEA